MLPPCSVVDGGNGPVTLLDVTGLGDSKLNTGGRMKRYPTNKHKSAKQFRRNVSTTKVINMTRGLQRGGWRL